MNKEHRYLEQRPTLSIIVPVYNTEPYLEEALNSILNQRFDDYEIIAVNDGSEDRSGEILDSYQEKDSRIHVYHRSHSGLSATRNFGFEKSGGIFVYFFDSDDILVPGALNRIIPLMQETGSEVIGFSGVNIDEEGKTVHTKKSYKKPDFFEDSIPGEDLFVDMMRQGIYSPVVSMYLYRKSFLQNNHMFFSEGYIHEDEAYTIQVLCRADRALSVSETFYKHRLREGSIMSGRPGIKNLEGWTEAVSQMVRFLNTYPVKPETEELVLARARQLTHNSIKIIQRLTGSNGKVFRINDYLSQTELRQLGLHVRLRSEMPGLFKIYNRVRKAISILS